MTPPQTIELRLTRHSLHGFDYHVYVKINTGGKGEVTVEKNVTAQNFDELFEQLVSIARHEIRTVIDDGTTDEPVTP